MTVRKGLEGILLLMGCVLAVGSAGAVGPGAEEAPRLFRGSIEGAESASSAPPGLRQRSRKAHAALDDLVKIDRLRLNLFDDVELVAHRRRVEVRTADDYSWIGRVGTGSGNVVVLVRKGERLGGSVRVGDRYFRITSMGPGLQEIEEVDLSGLPECGGQVPPPAAHEAFRDADGERTGGPRPGDVVPLADDGSTIDVMVLYTPDVWARRGPDIDVDIQTTIDEANAAYENSEILQRLRLVHTERIEYTESGNGGRDLDRLRRGSDGFLDRAHTLRTQYCADLVQLWVEEAENICGVAYLMSNPSAGFQGLGFGVVRRGCEPGGYVVAHELGHNMGAAHDRQNANEGAYSYSFGYQQPDGLFRTVMAYRNGCVGACPRVAHFSNPDVNVGTSPTGVPIVEPTSAHNAMTLNETAEIVAQFRDSAQCDFTTCTDEFENDDICSLSPPLTSQSRVLGFCEDADDGAKVGLRAGTSYTIETVTIGPDADTVLSIHEASDSFCFTPLVEDDDGGVDGGSRIAFTPDEDGCYLLQIQQADGSFGPGYDYAIEIDGEIDPSLCVTGLVSPGLLTVARDGALDWERSDQGTFNVYRGEHQGTFLGYDHTCFAAGVSDPGLPVDAERPGEDGRLFYYLVTGTADGFETAPGQDSAGGERPLPDPCP